MSVLVVVAVVMMVVVAVAMVVVVMVVESFRAAVLGFARPFERPSTVRRAFERALPVVL